MWQKHADDHKTEYPLAAEAVKNSCYMDDLMPSVETVETAKEMRQQLTKLGDKAGFHIRKWVDSVIVGFWVQGQSRNFKPFVSHRVGEIHDESSPDQWRYVPTKLNPTDQGTRGASVQELIKDDCWWYGPSVLKIREDEWPERKFGKASEAYKEVKSEKREQFVEKELSMNVQSYYGVTVTPKSTPNPMEYSKWYRINIKGKLEIGMSLVRVTGWINRFLANITRPQSDRESGELNPREIK